MPNRSTEEYSQLLDWGLRLTLMLTLPAAVALALLAVPLMTTLFQYGAFTAHDVLMTRNALVAYSVGLRRPDPGEDTGAGLLCAAEHQDAGEDRHRDLFATQAMNLVFIWPLQHAGLALAIGLGACLNASLLFYQLRQHGIYTPQPGWAVFLLRLALAVFAMASVLWVATDVATVWLSARAATRVAHLAGLVVLGAATYFAALWLVGIRLRDFAKRAAE